MDELAGQVALASRILATAGLAREATGHVSARTGDGRTLLRCRYDSEPGLRFTARSVGEVDFDADPSQAPDGMRLPIERHIHGQLLLARPEVNAVVHVHPWSPWFVGIAGIPLAPVLGAFDPGALSCVVTPPPIYPRSWLINSPRRGAELASLMAGHDYCLLQGHGIVTVGATVEQATVRALRLNTIAMASAMAHLAGSSYRIGDDELAELVSTDTAATAAAEHEVWLHYAEFAAHDPGPTGFLPFLY